VDTDREGIINYIPPSHLLPQKVLMASSESRQPENNSGTDNNPANAIPLQRSPWVLILATFYTALALMDHPMYLVLPTIDRQLLPEAT